MFVIADLIITIDLFEIAEDILADLFVNDTYFNWLAILFCDLGLEGISAVLFDLDSDLLNYLQLSFEDDLLLRFVWDFI